MKKLRQLYGGRRPKTYLPAHNHVAHVPGFGHGTNGFRRFWIPPEWVGRGWAKCPCGWRAYSWGDTHYHDATCEALARPNQEARFGGGGAEGRRPEDRSVLPSTTGTTSSLTAALQATGGGAADNLPAAGHPRGESNERAAVGR